MNKEESLKEEQTDSDELDVSDLTTGFTDQEQREIRARIDEIAGENRIAPAKEAFALSGAPRGFVLPLGVLGGVLLLVALSLLVMNRGFAQDEESIRLEAGAYVSVEGRLIRELRQESQEQIGAKQEEIDEIRSRLAELEIEQELLEQSIGERIAQREEEIRQELERELAIERARLIAQGTGSEDVERLMVEFERQRRAFYEQQLNEYREELEQERIVLQRNIDSLRAQYQDRIRELQDERDTLLVEFQRREADLRAQLQARTVAVQENGAEQAIAAAQQELAELNRQAEEERAIESQILGQIERIREATVARNFEQALDVTNGLDSYLDEERVAQLPVVARRREADRFMLAQLRDLLQGRIDEAGGSGAEDEDVTLLEELLVLDHLRGLADRLGATENPEEQGEVVTQVLVALDRLGEAQGLVNDALESFDALAAFGGDEEERPAGPTREELQVALEEYELALEATESELRQLALDSQATQEDLEERVSDLTVFQQQLLEARRNYEAYLSATAGARSQNPTGADLIARQELGEFLGSPIMVELFGGLATDVVALFGAVETAGSDAALADAADVVANIMNQPTAEARLNLLRFELISAEGNAELTTILEALQETISGTP